MIHLRDALCRNRPYILILSFVLLWPLFAAQVQHLTETRWWRDATARTPFHSVTVTSSEATATGARVAGEMVKRRCEFAGLSAYLRIGAVWERSALDTTPEDSTRPPGDRPSLPDAQLWGPWVIVWTGPPDPAEWAIYAHHRCPEGPQVNLFAAGRWPR